MSLLPAVSPDWVTAVVFAVGWALLFFLGQGLCIGLVVAAMLRGQRGRSADVRYATACLGLFMMMCCTIAMTVWGLTWGRNRAGIATGEPGTTFSVAYRQNRTGTAPDGTASPYGFAADSRETNFGSPADGDGFDSAGTQPKVGLESKLQGGWREPVERWLPALVTAWLAGVAVLTLRLLKGLAEVRGLTGSGLLGVTDELRSLIEKLEKRSGLRRPVRWFLSLQVEVPTVAGWLWPTILIPAKCWSRLAVEQNRSVTRARDRAYPPA
jgi:bla regulator protein blaR1